MDPDRKNKKLFFLFKEGCMADLLTDCCITIDIDGVYVFTCQDQNPDRQRRTGSQCRVVDVGPNEEGESTYIVDFGGSDEDCGCDFGIKVQASELSPLPLSTVVRHALPFCI